MMNRNNTGKEVAVNNVHAFPISSVRNPSEVGKNYYSQGHVSIINGNSTDSKLFDKPFADLIVTSPSYNLDMQYSNSRDDLPYDEYLKGSRKWLTNCYEWAKSQCRMCINVPVQGNKNGHHAIASDLTVIAQEVGWEFNCFIIWNKNQITNPLMRGSFGKASAPNVLSPVEAIIVLYKDSWKKTTGSGISDAMTSEEFITLTNGVWTMGCESRTRIGHPAPFHRELPRRCIRLFSFIGDVVFDPFLGSGTTLIEAQLNHRIGVGVDIADKYCELSKQRIIEACFSERREAA